jgi:N-acetylglucosamine-6-phosphate deacetylase
VIIHGARKVDADGIIEDFWLASADGRISAVGTGDGWRRHVAGTDEAADPETDAVTDAAGGMLTPGFIDLHGHGGGGADYDHDIDGIRTALAAHRAHGTTRSVLSLVTAPLDRLEESLDTIAHLAATDPLVLGAHLEGPFLAASHKGAHTEGLLRAPDAAIVERLVAAGRGALRQITIAPELPGGLDAVEAFVAAGVVVAVGHTAADYDTAREAFDRGARLVTHAFNALPGIHHRDPGPIVAAFDDERVTLELILDGVHVHPSVARIAFGAAPARIALITDAMAAAGGADGRYSLGGLDVIVRDGIARLYDPAHADGTPASEGAIAGSTLTMDTALRTALTAGIDHVSAVTALTLTPARVLGRDGDLGLLRPGYAADAVLLDASTEARHVWADGIRLT